MSHTQHPSARSHGCSQALPGAPPSPDGSRLHPQPRFLLSTPRPVPCLTPSHTFSKCSEYLQPARAVDQDPPSQLSRSAGGRINTPGEDLDISGRT